MFTAVAVLTLAIGIGANVGHLQRDRGRAAEAAAVSESPTSWSCSTTSAAGIESEARRRGAVSLFHLPGGRPRVSGRRRCGPTDTESVTGLAEPEEVPLDRRHRRAAADARARRPRSAGCSRSTTTRPSAEDTAILTAGYWRSRFGSDPSAIGRRIMVNGQRARDHRRPAGLVPVPRSEAVAHSADAARSRRRCFSDNSATSAVARLKAGRHARAGDRRRRAADPGRPHALPAVPGLQR